MLLLPVAEPARRLERRQSIRRELLALRDLPPARPYALVERHCVRAFLQSLHTANPSRSQYRILTRSQRCEIDARAHSAVPNFWRFARHERAVPPYSPPQPEESQGLSARKHFRVNLINANEAIVPPNLLGFVRFAVSPISRHPTSSHCSTCSSRELTKPLSVTCGHLRFIT